MVAGKVNSAAMGLQRSSANAKPKSGASAAPPLLSTTAATRKLQPPQKGSPAAFSRSFGVYFQRASVQVPPRPLGVSELLRLVEELRESELRLKAQLLEQKLLRDSVAAVPDLDKTIPDKNSEIERCGKKIECLEAENERLRQENEFLHMELTKQSHKYEEKIKFMQAELSDIKRVATEETSSSTAAEPIGELSSGRVPNPPPPRPSAALLSSFSLPSVSSACHELSNLSMIPTEPPPLCLPVRPTASPPCPSKIVVPPPPPPVRKGFKPLPAAKVTRVPEVVEFYHSLMGRDSNCRRGGGSGAANAQAAVATANDMIGEIKTRSTHLLAIKTDVETQGDFIRFLIKEVEAAAFTNIEAVVAFVKWVDDQLSNLVDERAVLKHFNWPEKKADALREAAFGYCDLKKLEADMSSFLDDTRRPCSHALKRMKSLFEKLEHGVYNLYRMRESSSERYKGFQIPVDWMLDTGYITQMKLSSVNLAMKYMKRVSAELELIGNGPEEQELIVQGVKFAFRVHQFAGGFDVETMKAFQELRTKAR